MVAEVEFDCETSHYIPDKRTVTQLSFYTLSIERE